MNSTDVTAISPITGPPPKFSTPSAVRALFGSITPTVTPIGPAGALVGTTIWKVAAPLVSVKALTGTALARPGGPPDTAGHASATRIARRLENFNSHTIVFISGIVF